MKHYVMLHWSNVVDFKAVTEEKCFILLHILLSVRNFICLRESVNMYIFGCLICIIIVTIIKPVNPYRLASFYFSGNIRHFITSYFSSCSFFFEHTGPPSYLTVLESGGGELSQAKGSVIEACWKPRQRTGDCAGCPGNTKAALRCRM